MSHKQAAKKRHQKFKQTRVQTFGGKKTKFSKAEKKRIEAAGYSVKGYSSASPKSDTSVQISKDIARYGNTVPAGSFGISKAGREQAERQKSVQGRFMPSNPTFRGVGAFSGPRPYRDSDYLTAKPYVNALKQTFGPNATLQGNRFNPADRVAAQGAGLVDSGVGLVNAFKNMGPQGLLGFGKKIPNVPTLPKFQDANLQKLRNFSSVAIPAAFTGGAASRLNKVGLGQEVSQMTLRNSAFNAGVRPTLTKTGITGVGPVTIAKAFTPGMLKTGPTAGGSAAILGTATGLSAAQQAKATDTQTGGLNIGRETPSNTGRSLTSRALGAVDAVVGTDLDGLGGRTTPFGERLTSSIDSFGTLRQNMSDLGMNMGGKLSLKGLQNTAKNISTTGKKLSMEDLATSTSFAKSFKDKPLDAVANLNPDSSKRVIKTLSALDKNQDVSQALANYGGEGFQKGLRDTASLAQDSYDKLSTDPKANRKVVSNILKADDPKADFMKRLAFQQKENPQLSLRSKIRYASDPNFKQYMGTDRQGNKVFENKIKGINRKEMGIIGGLGNFVLSNQGRDVVTGNVPGTNNALDLASNIINTGRDPSSPTFNASQRFLRTIGAGGQPTPGSIIRGINPFRRIGNTRGNSITRGSNTPVGRVPQLQNPAEVELPLIPESRPQQLGTDPNRLADIQNQSYQNTFNNLSAQFRPRYTPPRRRTFRTSFNRDYFSQYA